MIISNEKARDILLASLSSYLDDDDIIRVWGQLIANSEPEPFTDTDMHALAIYCNVDETGPQIDRPWSEPEWLIKLGAACRKVVANHLTRVEIARHDIDD